MDKRTVLALFLCTLLTFAWMHYNSKIQKKRQQQQPPTQSETPDSGGQPATSPAPPAAATPAPRPVAPAPFPAPTVQPAAPAAPATPAVVEVPPEPEAQSAAIETDHYSLEFTSRGAALKRAVLKGFYESYKREQDKPLVIVEAPADDEASLALRDPAAILAYGTRVYEFVESESSNRRLVYRGLFENGIEITKTFTVPEDRYHIEVAVTLANRASVPVKAKYALDGAVRLMPEFREDQISRYAVIGRSDTPGRVSVERVPSRKYKLKELLKAPKQARNQPTDPLQWVGTTVKYFAAILQPQMPEGQDFAERIAYGRAHALPQVEEVTNNEGKIVRRVDNFKASLETERVELQPGASVTDRYLLYLGPKAPSLLQQPEYRQFDRIIDYGFFGGVSRVLLWILHFFYRLVHNYGVAIILLTLVVRVALHPMTRKSQISMRRMQKLQPQIKALREKHKNDKQRQGQEQMKLFKEHGVNPMGGCLPLFLQFPVFIGLFRALQWSIELRQAPFAFWIHDLSRPDTIGYAGNWPVNILPVLMVISWLAQQMTMPKSPDPEQQRQQRFMLFMPIMFGVFLYKFASGLTLYWLTSTFFGLIEQKIIKKQMEKMDAESRMGPSAAGDARGKN